MLTRYAPLLLILPLALVALDACSARSTYQGGARREFSNAQTDTTTPPEEDSGTPEEPDTGIDVPDVGTIRDVGADG